MDLVYASAARDGANWVNVYDGRTGKKLRGIVEAHAGEGWVRRLVRDQEGAFKVRCGQLVIERIDMPVRLILSDRAPEEVRRRFAYANAMLSDG